MNYPVPLEEIRRQLTISNSRFISSLAPAFSVDAAKTFIARIKAELPDASHHVTLYIIGHGDSEIAHCSDAGEPSGTAGRPALAVLRGSGLGDVAVVVTRYFGGTKLGTGGLVRAYSEAVRLVVAAVPRAEKVLTHTLMLAFPYTYLERVRQLVAAQAGTILDEAFTMDVTLTARLRVENLADFQAALSDLTRGSVQAELISIQEVLMPLKPR
ncbi:MAG: YigZ family protein [Anaerolineales bacterium]